MRVRKMMPGLFGAALLAAIPAHAHEAEADGAARVTIVTSDVDRFYALYDDPALAAQPEVVAARYQAPPTPYGRASSRERVCKYVYISVVAVYLKKNTNIHKKK